MRKALLTFFILAALVSVFYLDRYFILPRRLQISTIGFHATTLTDIPSYERLSGGGFSQEFWRYPLTSAICAKLNRSFGCRETSNGFAGFRCIAKEYPDWCFLVRRQESNGASAIAYISRGTLILVQ
jgi:hypothetical protein